MNSHRMSPWIIILMFNSIWTIDAQNNNFIITDFGGIADGKTDNKQAFADAWKKACATNGGTISVPKGTFFVSVGDFEGPCTGPTVFKIDGTLVASCSENPDQWLIFIKIDGLTISGTGTDTGTGTGTFDGNGVSTWSRCKGSGNCRNRPDTLKLFYVKNVLIQDIHLLNSKMFHLNIYESHNVNVKNVHIIAPDDSPNTDGIHVAHSNYVKIMDSFIGTGDDCVSIGDGSRNINVTGVFCGPGHGISIGSLGKYKGEQDVSGITVRNCTLSKTDNGLRIKTWAPSQSSNIVSDVTFADINLDSADNPIIIDQYYCPSGSCVNKGESSVKIQGVKYIDTRGSSSLAISVNIQCSKSNPCQNIEFVGAQITYNGKPTTAVCSHQTGIKFQGSNQIPSRCS